MISSRSLFAITNNEIANTALKYDGKSGDTCKKFVQIKVLDNLGYSLGTGYRDCYLKSGHEIISINDLVRGDIIQLCKDSDSDKYYLGMHTAIVLENNNDGTLTVIDSNWCLNNCKMVSIHIWDPYSWANEYALQVHFYRLGEVVSNETFIKFSNSPKVYYVFKDQLWDIKDEATFYAMGNSNFDDVIEYPADQYDAITNEFPVRKTVVGEYLIAKLDCSPKVYLFLNGSWKHFDSWDVFTSYGYTDNYILEIPQAVFNMYAEGETLKFVLSQGFRQKYFDVYGFESLGKPINNPYSMPICNELDGTDYTVYTRQDFEKGTMFNSDNGNIEIFYYNGLSGIAEFKLINGKLEIIQYGIGGDAPDDTGETKYTSRSDSSQILIPRNIYTQKYYSWATGGYVNILWVVEEGTGHQMSDVDDFLNTFRINVEDLPPFRYRHKITNRKVNITNRSGMNARWCEMQQYGWLIPSNLESSRVEYIKGDFGLYGYYEKGTLERVAREQAEIAYRNYVAPIANEICQDLYNKNASSEQLNSLLAIRTTDKLKIRQVLMNVLPEPSTEFEVYFREQKANGLSAEIIAQAWHELHEGN
ncbi:hypothetical protein ACFL23_05065 [Patescibacteria group bacterium]